MLQHEDAGYSFTGYGWLRARVLATQVNQDRQQQEANQEKNEQNVQNMEQQQRDAPGLHLPLAAGCSSPARPLSPSRTSTTRCPILP